MFRILFILVAFVCCSAAPADALASVLRDSDSFVLARTVKLGGGESTLFNKGMCENCSQPIAPKNECSKNADCADNQKCAQSGKCEDLCYASKCSGSTPVCTAEDHVSKCVCSETSCPAGSACEGGKCVVKIECSVNSDCNVDQKCESNKCVNLCPDSSCYGETPNCTSSTHRRICVCDNTSCPAGYKCGGTACLACPAGEKCNCYGDTVSDGKGNCKAPYVDPCDGVSCPGGYCSAGSCSCSGNDIWDGSQCVTPKPADPCDGVSCGNGYCSGGSCLCYNNDKWDGSKCVSSEPQPEADNDAACKKYCGSGFSYDRPGAKLSGKERVCTKYPLSCGYNCTTGWDIDYLVKGTVYTCQTAIQTQPKEDKNADCAKYCGSGFYYDRPGAKYSGQERVCTKYPLSCGYNCTTGWDIKYANNPYTCQTAIQTNPTPDPKACTGSPSKGGGGTYGADCLKYCGSGYDYDRPGAKLNGKERVCTKYPKPGGYNCTTGWDIKYLVSGSVYTCQQAIMSNTKVRGY